jgi:SAM-dependent methyltransferase
MSETVSRYLDGLHGIEIGGSAFNDYDLDCLNIDRTTALSCFRQYDIEHMGRCRPIDILAEADALPFADGSFDYVFSSHVLEHLPDPIGAIKEWCRVAKRFVVMVVPELGRVQEEKHKRFTRMKTLLNRHDGRHPPDRKDPVSGHGHLTFWKPHNFMQMAEHMKLNVVELLSPDDQIGNGFLAIVELEAVAEPRRHASV